MEMLNPLIIQWVIDNYYDELSELHHASHDRCGEMFCTNAGGNVEHEDDWETKNLECLNEQQQLAAQYWKDNRKELFPLWIKRQS